MRAGDVLTVDFGVPIGSEPGCVRPTVLVSADEYLAGQPSTFQVVPITRNVERDYASDVPIPDLAQPSAARCRLVTTISPARIVDGDLGNVGAVVLHQIRSVLADLMDIIGTD